YTYLDFVRQAAATGIKATTIGASGLDDQGEFVWRQIAQYTMGLFVFLTYGEKGDSAAGSPALVSHHTGTNWKSRNLDAIIVQSIARELSHLADQPPTRDADYFEASPVASVANDQVIAKLLDECIRQLVDYSQVRLTSGTTIAVVPPVGEAGVTAALSASLHDRLSLAISRCDTFKLVERDQLKKVLNEIDLNDVFASDHASSTGKPLASGSPIPANMLVLSRIRQAGGNCEMLVRMVRADSSEIVSATMLRIDPRLLVTADEAE
ncbi:MAG: hypothetical protein PHU85_09990, partial [Phycisphaerae bacterium]|nr:hypothetical protein [Phycisphaerae bacterium]